jgi:hypothetical protein
MKGLVKDGAFGVRRELDVLPPGQGSAEWGLDRARSWPNLIGKPELSGLGRRAKISKQFNTSAFAQVPAGVPYGSAGRNILTAPAYVNTDFSAFKNFPIWEKGILQSRAEAFNVFNNVNLAAPNGVMTSPNFVRISGLVAGSQPRLIQFALPYSF